MKNKFIENQSIIIDNYSIDITPDKSLYYKIGESGHSFHECVAEFIDNSLDARTKEQRNGNETLRVDIIINVKKKFFSIKDNGTGMDKDTAAKAAILGKSIKNATDLGSFGFGLKSGLMAISNNFIVRSALEGNLYMTEFEYNNKDWVLNPDSWKLPAKSIIKEPNEHGTTIIINKVTKIQLSPNKTQYLKNDIAKRYRSFIQSGAVKITVNNVIVTVKEINWGDGYPLNFDIPCKYGTIRGKIGLMVESSQKGYYGFDIFRNGRMIVTNSKFAIGQHPTTARIAGEIHLDFVKVSHQKNKFIVESIEYIEAEQQCKNNQVFKDILREAKKKSEEGDNKKENVVIDKYIENNIPLIAQAVKDLEYNIPVSIPTSGKGIVKSKKGLLSNILTKFIERKRKPYQKKDQPIEKTIKSTNENRGNLIEINNQTFQISREYVYDLNMGRKSISFNDSIGLLTVFINKAFAGFKATKDKNSYCLETIQDAIVEFIYKDNIILIGEMNECKENLITLTLKYSEVFRESLKYEEEHIEAVSETITSE